MSPESKTSFMNRTSYQGKRERKFVLFTIDDTTFGVPVKQVSQVNDFHNVHQIPGTPNYVLGVVNLRGRIVTLINLKKRLTLGEKPPEKGESQVIFVDVGNQIIGMLVDKVKSLKSISVENVKEDLEMISTKIKMDFLMGAATIEDQIIILLNLDMVLSESEIRDLDRHQQKLTDALKVGEKISLPEEKLRELNLEKDDFQSFEKKDQTSIKTKTTGKKETKITEKKKTETTGKKETKATGKKETKATGKKETKITEKKKTETTGKKDTNIVLTESTISNGKE